jgi:hypothetical protein
MTEGWRDEEYVVLFDKEEVAAASERYQIEQWLPGYQVMGLRGWDDFIVRDGHGGSFTVPTVPVDSQYLAPFGVPAPGVRLKADARYTGKIKWYIKPLVFGGDPQLAENVTWVDYEQHGQLVRWWNDQYRAARSGQRGG